MDSVTTEEEFQEERKEAMKSYIIQNQSLKEESSVPGWRSPTEDGGRVVTVGRGPSFFTLTLQLVVTHLEGQGHCECPL